jgi:protein ImuA
MPALPAQNPAASHPLTAKPGRAGQGGRAPQDEAGIPRALIDLHPALWLGHQLMRSGEVAWPSGYAALDTLLPGGGWPQGVLSELLLAQSGVGEWRLLAPALRDVAAGGKLLMLFKPPALLSGAVLAALGLAAQQLLIVPGRSASDMLWALEQTLKSGHAGAVLAWLPARLPIDALRRLQFAAAQHGGPVFVLREWGAQQQPSPAPLRLSLSASGPDCLAVQILKRRGPRHEQALLLDLPPVLLPQQRARALAPRRVAIDAAQLGALSTTA